MPTKHTSNSEQPNRRPSARRSGTARETSGSRRTTRGSDSRRTAEGRPTQRSRTSSRERGNMSPQRKTIMRWRDYGVRAFGAAMVIGCIVGLIFFARPTTSTLENRTLTPFPAVTAESFLDGTFTSDVSLWYADTFPLREPLVRMNLGLKNLYGLQPDTQLIGGNRTSDELPPEGERVAETRERPHNIAAPEVRERAANIEEQITDGVYVDAEKQACYTLYYFDQGATQAYADVVNDAADLVGDGVNVYSVLLPTNAGIMLDDATLASLGVPNQKQAIDYFYSLMNDKVIPVPTFDVLYEHRDEELYFRTDFHWQQLAAYYVYTSFCKEKGIEPSPFDQWEELAFYPFVGEYEVAATKGFAPDTVYARIPQGTNEMEYWVDDLDQSSKMEGPVITDLTNAGDDENKYSCFVCGNRPLSHIHNPAVTDGSSCVVIKDSFGNPFVSVMVDNYEDIYTFDFRYSNQKLVDFVKEHNIQDVIFENVLMFAGTYDCSDMLSTIVYPDDQAASGAGASSGEAAAPGDDAASGEAAQGASSEAPAGEGSDA